MKKKNIIILVVIILLIIVLLCYFFVFSKVDWKAMEKEEENALNYHLKVYNTLEMCKTEDCEIPSTSNYHILSLEYDNADFENFVSDVNERTKKEYEEVLASDLDDVECKKVKDIYQYRYFDTKDYLYYEDETIISIGVRNTRMDLCYQTSESEQYQVILYDKETKSVLSQEEFLEKLEISEDEIRNSIQKNLDTYGEETDSTYELQETYEDILLFYMPDGSLGISFYIPEEQIYYLGTFGMK